MLNMNNNKHSTSSERKNAWNTKAIFIIAMETPSEKKGLFFECGRICHIKTK